jgi:uncharacterized protein (TIGR04255 family)
MVDSEVWPNAPLALVAVEARFPTVGGPLRPPVHRAIRDMLGGEWVLEGAKQQTMQIAFGSGGALPPNVKTEELTRITVRDRTRAVTVRPESLTIEATRYDGYPSFRPLLAAAFEAVERVLQPDGLTRLGMRYIDEIRIPEMSGAHPWDDWIDDSLLAPRVEGLTTRTWTSAVQYDVGEERRLVLRYGPADGPVVDPSGPLKRTTKPPAGPMFLLDFDSFWEPGGIPAFLASELLVACDQLREPVRRLFDRLISKRLINEVFGAEVKS